MSQAPITIRKARKEDLERIAEFVVRLKQVNEELDPMYVTRDDLASVARHYIERSLDDPNTILLVAEHESTVVGMVRAVIVDRVFYEPRIEALITDIYVHPSYRRRGVASLLIEKLAEEARSRGISLLAAEYPPGNRIAEKFFSRMGFKPLLVRVYRRL
jgi:ribosomal protein S18 acetylase RimI-like enzyme